MKDKTFKNLDILVSKLDLLNWKAAKKVINDGFNHLGYFDATNYGVGVKNLVTVVATISESSWHVFEEIEDGRFLGSKIDPMFPNYRKLSESLHTSTFNGKKENCIIKEVYR